MFFWVVAVLGVLVVLVIPRLAPFTPGGRVEVAASATAATGRLLKGTISLPPGGRGLRK